MSQTGGDVSVSARVIGEALYSYHYANFRIQTTTAIVGLTQSPGRRHPNSPVRDVFLQEAETPIGVSPPVLFQWPGRYGLSLHRLPKGWLFRTTSGMEFVVSTDGRQIRSYPGHAGWSSEASDVLIRRVLPRLTQFHGARAFHGAALAFRGRGTMLLGSSHAGKSTLAVALAQRPNWELLADDVVSVAIDAEFRVLPSSPSASLWEDSATALAEAYTASELLPAYQTKYRCDLPGRMSPVDAPLQAAYLLDPWRPKEGDTRGPQQTELPLPERLGGLVRHSIRFDPTDLEEEARRQRDIFRMATGVTMATLRYPLRYDVFPEVAALLETALLAAP